MASTNDLHFKPHPRPLSKGEGSLDCHSLNSTLSTNAWLLLGSNLGDRVNNLLAAQNHIAEKAGSIVAVSSLYETAAWGNENQRAFLNRALHITTNLPPEDLLRVLKSIEKKMGRKQTEKWGARLIDIDILLMDTIVYDSPTLSIPHPQMHKRRFTLVPLAEIAPNAKHPLLKQTVKELLKSCADKLEVRKFSLEHKTLL